MKRFSLARTTMGDWAPQCKSLVVDADPASRARLRAMLENQGIMVLEAPDGPAALALFEPEAPDLVFVDVAAARADDYRVVRRVKALAGERFVPVVLLTTRDEESALAECLEQGGGDCFQGGSDDFLAKPVHPAHLRAKLAVFCRVAQLHSTALAQYQHLLYEQELAQQVYAKTVLANQSGLSAIQSLQRPASIFSGDILLVEPSPSGELHVLVGDFTGHGLAAAIGAVPAADVFRGMTAKGFTPSEIIVEINRKLRHTLPTGMFLAAVFVCMDPEGRWAGVRNCGLPDVLVLGRHGARHRLRSTGLPLGVVEAAGPVELAWVSMGSEDRIVVVTDGVVEARSPAGEFFGDARLLDCLERDVGETAFQRLVAELDGFTDGAPQEDDLTLAVIPCGQGRSAGAKAWVRPGEPAGAWADDSAAPGPVAIPATDWHWDLELRAPTLRRLDAVPLLVDTVVDLAQGLREHRPVLFTILSELFNNALDHGVLCLDSRLKNSPEGFIHYFRERQERLLRLERGRVLIGLSARIEERGGWLEIRIEDDGAGFDFAHWQPNIDQPDLFSGRGIGLVMALCESLRYEGAGNVARAVYRW